MAIPILIVSHGLLAAALKESAEMIIGPLPHVGTAVLDPGEDPREMVNKVQKILDGASSGTLILADLFGGTPATSAAVAGLRCGHVVLTGANLAMVIEATSPEIQKLPVEKAAEAVKRSSISGIRNLNEEMKEKEI